MNLHEYQAKQLFSDYGVPVLPAAIAVSVEDAVAAAKKLGGCRWVVKAQVHAGGRGKAGGVKLVNTIDELQDYAQAMLGSRLVTQQTSREGLPVNVLLIEPACGIKQELYLSAVVDREHQRVAMMASVAGGMDIEEVAATQPEKLVRINVDPTMGLMPYQCRQVGFQLGLTVDQVKMLSKIMAGIYRLFVEKDASLVEVNPLIVTDAGELLALDAKINIDDNALYRQKALSELRDTSQEEEKEVEAQQHELNYISLSGSIGCMVNGAGLAMATLDMIHYCGGTPANFLDVGGGATKERVTEAFKLILRDPKVEGILVNIFGGIMRCDVIAEGVVAAAREISLNVPLVVRLEGTNVDLGKKILAESGLPIVSADDLGDAAEKIVTAVKEAA